MAYLLLVLILVYSGWTLYRSFKEKAKGNCSSCSDCSLSGGCPVQNSKTR